MWRSRRQREGVGDGWGSGPAHQTEPMATVYVEL